MKRTDKQIETSEVEPFVGSFFTRGCFRQRFLLQKKNCSQTVNQSAAVPENMKDAIAHGNRLIMMMNGKIILDIQGEEKKKLTVKQLLDKFEEASGEEFSNDSAILG